MKQTELLNRNEQPMSDYKVGQVLYLAKRGKAQLTPVLVVEQLNKKTLNGETVTYTVKMGTAESTKMFDLSTISAEYEVFAIMSDAKKVLTDRAIKAVASVVEMALQQASQWYGVEAQNDIVPDDTVKFSDNDQFVSVTLEDGTTARVKLPST